MIVSPGRGMRAACTTKSIFELPTTTMWDMPLPPDEGTPSMGRHF
jgi:hypothetical protein